MPTTDQKPLKICFYSDSEAPIDILAGRSTVRGGAEKQIAHLMLALAERGHEIYLLYRAKSSHTKVKPDLLAVGKSNRPAMPAQQSPANNLSGITCLPIALNWYRPYSLFTLWQTLIRVAPDLLYARLPDDFLWLLGLYTKSHKPARFAYAIANDRFCNPWRSYHYKSWFHNPLYALGLATADWVLIQHHDQEPMVKAHSWAPIALVPNLIEEISLTMRDIEATCYDAIWVSQIRPQKQLALFLDLVEALPHRQFALIGGFTDSIDNSIEEAYRQRINQLPNLTYLGLCTSSESQQQIAQSKVLLNTSHEEGFPNTMLEAWSMGVPVISLRIDPGGVIATHQLGRVSQQMTQFCVDVEAVIASSTLNQQLGANGLAYVRQYHSVDHACSALLALVADKGASQCTLNA